MLYITTVSISRVPSSSCRGTFDIVTLCLSTVVICVWSAIHWDIPLEPLNAGLGGIGQPRRWLTLSRRFIKQRGPFVLVAIFLPALLLFRAINQFVDAWKLVRSVRKHIRDDESCRRRRRVSETEQFEDIVVCQSAEIDIGVMPLQENSSILTSDSEKCDSENLVGYDERLDFTFVHAFYAVMGGFQLTIRDQHGRIDALSLDLFPHGQTDAKLTAKGVQLLLEYDPYLIPNISLSSISERSKSNTLGKIIMVSQVVWFCLNCLSRLLEDMSLSLLEISTLAHGFCMLISCAIWWHKPLNISSPTWIRVDSVQVQEALSFMLVADKRYTKLGRQDPEFVVLEYLIREIGTHKPQSPSTPRVAVSDSESESQAPVSSQSSVFSVPPRNEPESAINDVFPVTRLEHALHTARRYFAWASSSFRFGTSRHDFGGTDEFWSMIWPVIFRPNAPGYYLTSDISWGFGNFFDGFTFRSLDVFVFVSAITPIIYGSLHFLGWRAQFPTPIEHQLWRAATLVTLLPGVAAILPHIVLLAVLCVVFWLGPFDDRGQKVLGYAGRLHKATRFIRTFIIPIFYSLASMFLLIESVRQLWYLSPDAYRVASWSYYIPHLS